MTVADDRRKELVRTLRRDVSGQVITADHPEYEEARRVWNGMIDRRPLAVVRAAAVTDAAPVVRIARENDLLLAIRGGGHGVAGNGTAEDGLVLDLGQLKRVDVETAGGTVRIEPGATLADVDRATEVSGLAVPLGVVSATGVAGLILGGGVGWLTRAYGLTIDSLRSVELVTANGDVLTASKSEHSDLFWGLRGGGGNFGVVTSFTFEARSLGPEVFGGNLIYRRPRWAEALRAFASWTRELPDELTSIVSVLQPPPSWELGDDTVLIIGFAWAGRDATDGEHAAAPLRRSAPPDEEVVGLTRWIEWQSAADELFPPGSRAYWKNVALDELDAAVETIVQHLATQPAGIGVDIHHMGGAFSRIPEDATAFPNRSTGYWLNIYGFWRDPASDEHNVAWVRNFHRALEPWAAHGEYVNFLGREGGATDRRQQAVTAYGPAKFERLVELKRRYDPTNLFRLNHNIPPD